MRIVLIDDEHLPLTRLRTLLEKSKVPGIEIVGEYTDSLTVLNHIEKLQPNVVFLDIVMPGMDGLALGEKIQELLPNVEIVFTTGFDQYAIDAFNLHAIDYLLKPIQIPRLEKTLERLGKISNKNKKATAQHTMLKLFGGLYVVSPDGHTQLMKWRTSKAKELFAYMLNHRNEVIYRDTILELFWPESDIDKASKQLYTAIYTIRQTLKHYGLDSIQISSPLLNSGYKLLVENAVVDVEQWLSRLKLLSRVQATTLEEHEQVFQMYTGDFLGDCDYLWAEGERERLRRLWLHHASQLSEFYSINQNYIAAVKVRERVQALCADEEENYFTLMKLYDLLNNAAAVEEQYLLLKKMLREHFAVEPCEEVESWYRSWKQINELSRMDAFS
ncbi:response regulator [Lysinibacillus macroides]|uniref:Histidine kinase n=1 Tax=Lysinibacillus macroides TaxID=33935 RepID=A0A0M9DLB2_9BACI|nr:response regulator [Lysinibacillus macroides]KOY83758.1 histidine kinase [Lysinibacillus macroides]QPR67020.1 response regulator [Lysinibacillus macroides]